MRIRNLDKKFMGNCIKEPLRNGRRDESCAEATKRVKGNVNSWERSSKDGEREH